MEKIRRGNIVTILALCLLLLMSSGASANIAEGKTSRFTWSIDNDGVLTISGKKASNSDDHPWTDYADQITEVVLSDGLEVVVDEAFAGMTRLTLRSEMPGCKM